MRLFKVGYLEVPTTGNLAKQIWVIEVSVIGASATGVSVFVRAIVNSSTRYIYTKKQCLI